MGRSSRILGLITGLACVSSVASAADAATMGAPSGGAAPKGIATHGAATVAPMRGGGPVVAPFAGRALSAATGGPAAGRPTMRGPEARNDQRFRRLAFRRHSNLRRGQPFGAYDYGYNFDTGFGSSDPYAPSPGVDELDGPLAADEPPYLPEPPRPCIRPLIIRIGRGLRHPATRVVYGGPPACVRGY